MFNQILTLPRKTKCMYEKCLHCTSASNSFNVSIAISLHCRNMKSFLFQSSNYLTIFLSYLHLYFSHVIGLTATLVMLVGSKIIRLITYSQNSSTASTGLSDELVKFKLFDVTFNCWELPPEKHLNDRALLRSFKQCRLFSLQLFKFINSFARSAKKCWGLQANDSKKNMPYRIRLLQCKTWL